MRDQRTSKFRRHLVLVVAFAVAGLGFTGQAAADDGDHHARPNLVALGDSFAAGVGNVPYRDSSACKTSDAAYGPLLAAEGKVRLQAFPACSGATTVDVWTTGPLGHPAQINSITSATNIVTVQALGNDFHVSQIEGLCVISDCSASNPLVQQVIASIPVAAPGLLDALYTKISAVPGFHGRVLAIGYPNPFPRPHHAVGTNCPYMTAGELTTAQTITNLFNSQIRQAAKRHGFTYVPVNRLFRGHDMCGNSTAFYTPGPPSPSADPEGAVHPNVLGQRLLAKAVAAKLGCGDDESREGAESDDCD
jgi:lysophospholipase L1-like esterase